jgi:hypothetical protein
LMISLITRGRFLYAIKLILVLPFDFF